MLSDTADWTDIINSNCRLACGCQAWRKKLACGWPRRAGIGVLQNPRSGLQIAGPGGSIAHSHCGAGGSLHADCATWWSAHSPHAVDVRTEKSEKVNRENADSVKLSATGREKGAFAMGSATASRDASSDRDCGRRDLTAPIARLLGIGLASGVTSVGVVV